MAVRASGIYAVLAKYAISTNRCNAREAVGCLGEATGSNVR
jgi:hypothetical protein